MEIIHRETNSPKFSLNFRLSFTACGVKSSPQIDSETVAIRGSESRPSHPFQRILILEITHPETIHLSIFARGSRADGPPTDSEAAGIRRSELRGRVIASLVLDKLARS